MRKQGTDPNDVTMSDVLCDFCRREWTEDVPMVEGHRGSCICGRCLTVAYTEVVLLGASGPNDFLCPMCREARDDRAALGRGEEAGWRSAVDEDAVVCRRCIEMAAKALDRDRDIDWSHPKAPG